MSARILVVDDILPNVKLLEAKLSAEYYEVITASSGFEALELAQSHNPDLILLDIMMPGMDGFEACAKLKANPKTQVRQTMYVAGIKPNRRSRSGSCGCPRCDLNGSTGA